VALISIAIAFEKTGCGFQALLLITPIAAGSFALIELTIRSCGYSDAVAYGCASAAIASALVNWMKSKQISAGLADVFV